MRLRRPLPTSPDFNTMTVENEIRAAVGGQQPGKAIDVWVRR